MLRITGLPGGTHRSNLHTVLHRCESPNPALNSTRFVTHAELDCVGLGHLVGTPLLRAFMHA